jgi:hypothetical protein
MFIFHHATSRKVAGSIPDVVTEIFSLPNPSSRHMALGSTQPPTEMSTRNIPRSKGRPGFASGQHVGFVVDKAALGQIFSEYFGFPCQLFHQFLHHHNHPGLAQ